MAANPQPLPIRIRPMREVDIETVAENEAAAYRFPWSVGVVRDCMRVGYACWVAEDAGGVIGHTVLSVAAGEAHLLNLCVHPAHQRQGLGRQLLDHILGIARAHAARTLYLEVRPANTPAITLYLSSGFRRIGTRRAYYPAETGSGREDAIVLERTL